MVRYRITVIEIVDMVLGNGSVTVRTIAIMVFSWTISDNIYGRKMVQINPGKH